MNEGREDGWESFLLINSDLHIFLDRSRVLYISKEINVVGNKRQ